MDYLSIKHLHMTFALLSITGFIFRSILKLRASEHLKNRWLRVLPHCIDTGLLACAIYLCIASGQYPLSMDWLTAKIVALLFYIGFGILLMRFAQTLRAQMIALTGALLSFSYIVAVALTHSAAPWG